MPELEQEIAAEKIAKLPEQEAKLHKIIQNLLVYERDWNAPGTKMSDTDRVERLLDIISKEDF